MLDLYVKPNYSLTVLESGAGKQQMYNMSTNQLKGTKRHKTVFQTLVFTPRPTTIIARGVIFIELHIYTVLGSKELRLWANNLILGGWAIP